jgi:FkbM family methyltransferase
VSGALAQRAGPGANPRAKTRFLASVGPRKQRGSCLRLLSLLLLKFMAFVQMRSFLSELNQSSLWRRKVRLWDSVYTAPTLDRLISLHAHRFGWMGYAEKRFLRSVVRDDSIVADVGANQGLYTLWLARVAASGKVYAFEPDPDLFQCLENNVRTNHLQNVSTIQAAASNRSGTLAFTTNGLNRGDNRVDAKAFQGTDTKWVRAVILDEIISHQRLDLLKVDVQGFEIEVLLGAQKTLQANPAVTIVFEFWPYGLRQAGHRPNELWDLLQEAGFSIAALAHDGRLSAAPPEALRWERKTQYCNLIAQR